ncbi:MAG TPA: hypothetical protein VLS89_03195, partial [Candidatus Nanopelagicales bacterium]|nr:hypothetical protein [Candidatus Nanopelagicales bacterium]
MRPVERQGDAATCGHPNTGSSDVFVNDRGATRVGVDSAGGSITGPGAPRVLVNGAPFSLQGDSIAPHGPAPHQAPKTSNPSQNVFVCLPAAASPPPSPGQPAPQQPAPQQPPTPQQP